MDDGIAYSRAAVAPAAGTAPPFTARQVMILRLMLGIMALTLVGGGGLVVAALVWKLRQAPAVAAPPSIEQFRALAATQPGVAFAEGTLPIAGTLIGTHMLGDSVMLVYRDAAGTTLARFDARTWKLTGVARLTDAPVQNTRATN